MEPELLPEGQAKELCQRLGYRFRDVSLLLNALCHTSFVNEQPHLNLRDNERLEFLGDAVLDLAVSHILMERFQDAEEGLLSRYRAMIVDETGLCQVATRIGLGKYLFLGKGEELSGGRAKASILADAMEALIGAIYLDGGFGEARNVIARLFSASIKELDNKEIIHDFKSLLQEFTQHRFKTIPTYRLVAEWGPPHDKVFRVALAVKGQVIAHGEGKSKKEAEQNAAREAFMNMAEK